MSGRPRALSRTTIEQHGGNHDASALDEDIIAIVHVTYGLR